MLLQFSFNVRRSGSAAYACKKIIQGTTSHKACFQTVYAEMQDFFFFLILRAQYYLSVVSYQKERIVTHVRLWYLNHFLEL